jgi:hypothetical protein
LKVKSGQHLTAAVRAATVEIGRRQRYTPKCRGIVEGESNEIRLKDARCEHQCELSMALTTTAIELIKT